jgi:hypothetical protein
MDKGEHFDREVDKWEEKFDQAVNQDSPDHKGSNRNSSGIPV